MARASHFVVALLIVSFVTVAVRGQTWKGPGTDWNTAANWTPAAVPNSSSAAVIFGDTGVGTVNISASVAAQSITFNNTSGNYNLTMNNTGITLSGVTAITMASNVTGVDAINLTYTLAFPNGSSLTLTNNALQSGSALVIGPNTIIASGNSSSSTIIANGVGQTTFSGSFAGSVNAPGGGLVKNGPGTFRFQGNGQSLSGGLTQNGGLLELNYATSNSTKWASGLLTLGGGTLSVVVDPNASFVQTSPGGTLLTGGHTDMVISSTGPNGIMTFQLGSLARSGTATFDVPTGGAVATYSVTTSTGNSSAGLLGTGPAYVTYNNGATWATVSGGTITGYSGYVGNTYTTSTANVDVTASGNTPAGFTVNSLRLNNLITLSLTGTNTLQSGGILDISNINGVGDTITGGTLTAPSGGELIVHQYGTAPLTINSALSSTAGLTKTGPGTLTLGGTNTGLTAPINISRGGLTVTTLVAVNSASAINFNDNRSGANLQSFTVDLGNNTNGAITPNIRVSAFDTVVDATNFSTGSSTGSRITLSGVLGSGTGLTTPIVFTGAAANTSGFNLTNAANSITGNIGLVHGTLGITSDAVLGNAANFLTLALNDTSNGGVEFLAGGITVNHPINLQYASRIVCNGTDSNTIASVVSGASYPVKAGTGTLTLTNPANTFAGGLLVTGGTLAVGANGTVLPAGILALVNTGATLSLGTYSNSAAAAMGTFYLDGGTLKVPGGSGDYYVNKLLTTANGGTVDLGSATNFGLHFTNAGAAITFGGGTNNLIGGGSSRFLNDTAGPLTVTGAGSTTIGVILSAGGANPNFTITGSARLTNTGNTANITASAANLYTNDLATNLGGGAFGTLGTGTTTLTSTTLIYDGPTAITAKPLTLGSGGAGVLVSNAATTLTLSGVVGESAAGTLFAAYGPGTLAPTAANTYTGPTVIGLNGVLATPSIPNGGTAGPLGMSASAPANLVLGQSSGGGGTLRYTGATSITDRGLTTQNGSSSTNANYVEVTNAATNLTITGQLTGSGVFFKIGPGTLTLSNATNNYQQYTTVFQGTMALGADGPVIPGNSTVYVQTGGMLDLGGFSNSTNALGAVYLNGGTLRASTGSGTHFTSYLETNSGGPVDFSGSVRHTIGVLNIQVNGSSTWVGLGGVDSFTNGAPANLGIVPTATLTNGIPLYADLGYGFQIVGGGTLYESGLGGNAPISVKAGRFRTDDMATGGVGALGSGPFTLDGGTLQYSGLTAPASTKPIAVTAAGGTIEVTAATTALTLNGAITGGGGLTKTGSGALLLGNTGNTFTSLNVVAGTVQTANDNSLGTGPVTIGPFGTLTYTGSTSTNRTFTCNNGTLSVAAGQTVTVNAGAIGGGFLRGPGTFALTGGTVLSGVTVQNSAVLSQTGAASFVNVSNAGGLTIATGQSSSMNGFVNQGSGSIALGATALLGVADFQTYGTMTINPATLTQNFSQTTLMTNTGTSQLYFNGGSRTFVGTPTTAVFPSNWPDQSLRGLPTFVAGIDLNGKNAVVAGGLFVNNGYVEDSTNNYQGAATIIADFGSLVKGAGYFQNSVQTVNGGKFQAGNSPGSASFGNFVLGPGGVSSYVFAIDDATGAAGPTPDAGGHVSGWGLVRVGAPPATHGGLSAQGDFTWTATPADKLLVSLETLVNPTTVGVDVPGLMDHFEPTRSYVWPAVEWAGSYAGPADDATLDAATAFDTTGFANPVAGRFGWSLDSGGHTLSLTYTPTAVPEPGSLVLVGLVAGGWFGFRSRRRCGLFDGERTAVTGATAGDE